jgi:hypothetical protein
LYSKERENYHVLADASVAKHLVRAYDEGWIKERICRPLQTACFVAHKLGRSCLLCHAIDRTGSASYITTLTDSMYPDGVLFVGGVPAPNPICRPCHQAVTMRLRKYGDGPHSELDILQSLLDFITSKTFRKRCEKHVDNTALHRFDISLKQTKLEAA